MKESWEIKKEMKKNGDEIQEKERGGAGEARKGKKGNGKIRNFDNHNAMRMRVRESIKSTSPFSFLFFLTNTQTSHLFFTFSPLPSNLLTVGPNSSHSLSLSFFTSKINESSIDTAKTSVTS